MTERLEREAAMTGLCISAKKTEIMAIGYIDGNNYRVLFIIGQHQLDEVHGFTYMGSDVVNNGDSERDVACRIGKASAVFQRRKPIWASRPISTKSKVRLFNSTMIPSAIYAVETWKTLAKIARMINAFQLRYLRRILLISYPEHITNNKIHRQDLEYSNMIREI
ncbi:Hypothetical predicted protein [Octopus vulgaris]|uniref:Reverse transcriptase domain-containing protein n=1 Tax=Octopus vulgaris TaxID=6645 RepID=A0AA36B5Q3_OCTVU|nr:Hypothetical predicted protein [Octopus vulgaris]